MKKKYFFLVFFTPFFSCNEKKTEFIRSEKRVQTFHYEGRYDYLDIVFIVNPPDKWADLVKLIDDYNSKTVNKDKVINSFDAFDRVFYRETRRTPRDFEDDESFIPDRLGDHSYDRIAMYSMKQCNGIRLKDVKVDSTQVEWKLEAYSDSPYSFDPIYYGHTCFE